MLHDSLIHSEGAYGTFLFSEGNVAMIAKNQFVLILKTSSCLALMLAPINEANSATPQPKMNEPAVDAFGLELKSGRVSMTTPLQISIGGEGASALSISYSYEGTMMSYQGYRAVGFPFVRYSLVQLGCCESYDYYSIEYPGGSDTFRRAVGSTGAFAPEFSTGSTLVQSGSDLIFTTKFGEKFFSSNISGGNSWGWTIPYKVSYPDGRELYLSNGAISNNFGYSLREYQSVTQAINRSVDYCNFASPALCVGLQASRSSSYSDVAANQRNFTDAGGGVTKYRLVSITALDREPFCSVNTSPYGGSPTCDTPSSGAYYYPAGLTLPGFNAESLSMTYAPLNLPPPPYNAGSNVSTHDDVRVASITKDGVTANYAYSKYKYGNWGQVNYNLPYRLLVTTTVNGVNSASSMANKPNSSWRVSGRRYLEWAKDGLGRQTNFGINAINELSSITLPEGNSNQFVYDSRFNVIEKRVIPKPGSGQSVLVTTYTYPSSCTSATQATCNLPLSVTDPKGNVTTYTYNSAGQVLTETRPPASAGGVSQVITNTYTMRTAYIKNSSGLPVAAGPAISLLTSTSSCRTLASCVGTSDEVVTLYDYGPTSGLNNLNLRGVGVRAVDENGQIRTLWTCYSYNYFGERISETKPKAGLTSCS